MEYIPPPTVAAMMRSQARTRVILGPIGSGKSVGCVMTLVQMAKLQAPGRDGIRRTRAVLVRNTRQQLRDTTFKTLTEWLPIGQAGSWRETDMTFTLDLGDTRCEFLFRPLDTADDVRRLLSLEPTFAWVNEAREIPEEIITGLRSRLGRYPPVRDGGPTRYGLICDTNFPDQDSYWHKVTDLEIPPTWEVFKQPGGLDPAAENRENLPPTYYEDAMAGASQDWIDVHVHAKYGTSSSGRPVYEKSFNPEFHIAKGPLIPIRSTGYPLVIGMDFGRTPAAAIKQRDARGRVLTLREVYNDNSGLENFLRQDLIPVLTREYPENRFFVSGDPSGWAKSQLNEECVADIFQRMGLRAVRAPTNLPDRRIAAVEGLLSQQIDGAAMYLVDPSCRRLIAGFKHGYRYKKRLDGSYEDVPDKKVIYSHIHDANQYADLMVGVNDPGAALGQRREIVQSGCVGWT